jgi:hypothetical protein
VRVSRPIVAAAAGHDHLMALLDHFGMLGERKVGLAPPIVYCVAALL